MEVFLNAPPLSLTLFLLFLFFANTLLHFDTLFSCGCFPPLFVHGMWSKASLKATGCSPTSRSGFISSPVARSVSLPDNESRAARHLKKRFCRALFFFLFVSFFSFFLVVVLFQNSKLTLRCFFPPSPPLHHVDFKTRGKQMKV